MKRNKYTIAIILIGLCGIGLLAWVRTYDQYRDFFEEESGIKFPKGVTNVVHNTELEFTFSSHYTLPQDTVESFIQSYQLSAAPPPKWEPIFRPDYMPSPWDKVPASGKLYYATGASDTAAWDILLDRASGELWTSIYYADYSGDLPPRVSP